MCFNSVIFVCVSTALFLFATCVCYFYNYYTVHSLVSRSKICLQYARDVIILYTHMCVYVSSRMPGLSLPSRPMRCVMQHCSVSPRMLSLLSPPSLSTKVCVGGGGGGGGKFHATVCCDMLMLCLLFYSIVLFTVYVLVYRISELILYC